MKRELVQTADGSLTLFVPTLNEHYHSVHGALQEATHVFLQHGLDLVTANNEIHVLELGLGTCLNAYLSLKWSVQHNRKVVYYGVEPFPVEGSIIAQCLRQLGETDEHLIAFFQHLEFGINNQWEKFTINPLHCTWQSLTNEDSVDVIFYDAFGPRAQEELWTKENFQIAYKALKKGGLLSTYCAKGQVKRDLKAVGFKVETLVGPRGKREMTVARKS